MNIFGLTFEQLKALMITWGPIAALVAPLLVLWQAASSIAALLVNLATKIDQAAALLQTSGVGQHLGLANRLFPVSETLGLLSLLIATKLLAAGIRIVKSWIPTVS